MSGGRSTAGAHRLKLAMRKDLEEKVAVTLARFDKAVKDSSTRSDEPIIRPETRMRRELSEDAATGKPSCRPWDYDDFTLRLGTFTPFKWFGKPHFASPPVCARFGWTNTGRDILSCQCCSAQLQYAPEEFSDGGGNAVQPASFLSRLKSEHHDLCPWNGNACPAEFLHLPAMAGEDLRSEFLTRLSSIVSITTARALPEVSLPADFELHCPGGLSALAVKTRALLAGGRLCSSSDTPRATAPGETEQPGVRSEEDSTQDWHGGASKRQRCGDAASSGSDSRGLLGLDDHVVGTAAAIAVFGWQAVATVVVGSPPEAGGGTVGAGEETSCRLRCTACNRRVVTDNFLTVDIGGGASSPSVADRTVDATGMSSTAGGPSGKRRRLSGGGTPLKAMDLAAEHRSFCPWAAVHPAVEGDKMIEGVVPGWQQSLEAVLRWADPSEVPAKSKEVEGFSDATNSKAEEALQRVQKVLGVLMRY